MSYGPAAEYAEGAGDVDGVVGIGAGIPVHEQLLRRDPAVGANARLDPIGEGAPARQQAEFLLAGGLELHGPSVRLAGQTGEERLEVDAGLAPEATADVRYDDAHFVVGKLEGVTEQVPDGERRLSARPDGHLVAGFPLDDGDVSLQRDVLHRRVGVVALDDPVRLGETGLDVTLAYPRDIGDVRARLRAEGGLDVLVAAEVGVHPGGVGIKGFELAQHRRQDLVLDVDQVDGPAGDVQALSRHRGDGLAEMPGLALGEDGLVYDVQPDPVVELLTGEDGMHPRQALSLGSVDGDDPCPRVRALLDLGIQHAGEHHVARVHGAARQLDGVVGTLNIVANPGRERKDGGLRHISVPPLSLR